MITNRCAAAHHTGDPTPCLGPTDAVLILDHHNAGTDACEHHGARLLPALDDARPISGPHSPGAAIRVFKAAADHR